MPATAILDKDGKSSVWLVQSSGTVTNRPVTLADHDNTHAVVASGLAPGDRVVTVGVHSLSEGQPVRVDTP